MREELGQPPLARRLRGRVELHDVVNRGAVDLPRQRLAGAGEHPATEVNLHLERRHQREVLAEERVVLGVDRRLHPLLELGARVVAPEGLPQPLVEQALRGPEEPHQRLDPLAEQAIVDRGLEIADARSDGRLGLDRRAGLAEEHAEIFIDERWRPGADAVVAPIHRVAVGPVGDALGTDGALAAARAGRGPHHVGRDQPDAVDQPKHRGQPAVELPVRHRIDAPHKDVADRGQRAHRHEVQLSGPESRRIARRHSREESLPELLRQREELRPSLRHVLHGRGVQRELVLVAAPRVVAEAALRREIEEQRARRDVVLAHLPAVRVQRRVGDPVDGDEHLEVGQVERPPERLLGDDRAAVVVGTEAQRLAALRGQAEPLGEGLRGDRGRLREPLEHLLIDQRLEQLADLLPIVGRSVRPGHGLFRAKALDLEQLLAQRRDVRLVEDELDLAVEEVQDLLSFFVLHPVVGQPPPLGDAKDLARLKFRHGFSCVHSRSSVTA